ncbi:Glutathione S-transferase kappa 1 [Entophlyctis luteolus]|nr:Glutathione S-transferase kappa 1 [Entophlyctis luteolus]
MSKITFYYDVVSPYSWFGFEIAHRYQRVWKNVRFEFVPVFLGGIMAATGNLPPATNPYKGAHMVKEILFFKKMYDVDIGGLPAKFPSKTLLAQRVLTAMKLQRSDKLEPASRAFWVRLSRKVFAHLGLKQRLFWRDGKDIESKTDLLDYLSKVVSPAEAARLINEDAQNEDVKKALTAATAKLVEEQGAFGLPWMVVSRSSDGEEMGMFGSDRFEAAAWFLGEMYEGPSPKGNKAKL